MPLAIIAGMPSGKARQFGTVIAATDTLRDWDLAWIPSRKNQADLGTCWERVKEGAVLASETGAHVLAYHKAISERAQYEEEVRFRHRLVWLDHASLYGQSSDQWWREIEGRLRLEEAWRRDVRPPNQHHPLILPAETFASQRNPWTTAQRAETERTIARARSEIGDFLTAHRHHGVLRDDNALLFDSRGPQHGHAPDDRRWKFTLQLPVGFHFDVRHEDGREFSILSADGTPQRFHQYTNVDAHGYIRGGE